MESDNLPLIYEGFSECLISIVQDGFVKFIDIDTQLVVSKSDLEFEDMAYDFLEKLFKKAMQIMKNKVNLINNLVLIFKFF